jgi:hypothetical protein
MALNDSKARFIRDEFDCFVRIGMNAELRGTLERRIEVYTDPAYALQPIPVIYFEVRETDGTISEMWHLEPDRQQLARLISFLHRFSIEDVKLMHSLLQVT